MTEEGVPIGRTNLIAEFAHPTEFTNVPRLDYAFFEPDRKSLLAKYTEMLGMIIQF